MNARFLAVALVVGAGCASEAGPGNVRFTRVEDPAGIPGLVEWAEGVVGRAFEVDRLPKGRTTLEAGFRYLTRESEVDLVREPLVMAGTVFGAEFEVPSKSDSRNGTRFLVYSPTRDFMGTVVYALFGMDGPQGAVFLGGRQSGRAILPRMKRVDAPQDIPGLVDRLRESVGKDFVLGHLPQETRTLEEGFTFLSTEARSDVLRKPMTQAGLVFGAELTVLADGEERRIYAYSPHSDFSLPLVYALFSADGRHLGVFRLRQ